MTDALDKLKGILDSHAFVPPQPTISDYAGLQDLNINSNSLEEVRFESTSIEQQSTEELDELLQFKSKVKQFNNMITPLSDYLLQFNQKLLELSKELESLKSKSVILASNLDKRKSLEKKYVPIVSDLIIPPEIIKDIYNNDINKEWCENLQFLKDKIDILSKYEDSEEFKHMNSLKTIKSLIEALQLKSTERIRNFLILKIKQLRVIGTSSQVIQQDLIKVKEIFPFLSMRYPSLALELRQAYIYTMKWYYQSHFKRYFQALQKLKLYQFDKTYLLGIKSSSSSSSFFSSKSTSTGNVGSYSIGKRSNIIKAEDPTVMLAQIAEHNNLIFNMEIGFRSFNLALIDNGSVEYLFLLEFFQLSSNEILGVFEQIFKPTFDLGIEYTKQLITNTFDIFGVLILIRLSQSLIYELQTRRIPVLEDYFNLQMIILWPQFQKLIDMNVENMKKTSLKSSSIAEINNSNNKPHQLTVQFTNLIYGFLKLTLFETVHINDAQQEPLFNSLSRLNSEFEMVMTKLSKVSKKNNGEMFLFQNYSYVLGILNDCEGFLARIEIDHFKKLTEAYKEK